MKKLLPALVLSTFATAAPAAWFTNNVSVDSFLRAAAPGSNYGGAGALAVSGETATNATGVANGAFDTFIRFNTALMTTQFNARFGPSNWVVTGATLRVTEVAAPNNALFNRGVGAFEIRWLANDNWVEGTGNPNTPATTGITFNDEPVLLSIATDASLGSFTNAGLDGTFSYPLALPAGFVGDLISGSEVGLFLTATSPMTGFTFDSRSFGTASARPYLEVSVAPRPVITSITISGSNVLVTATNGIVGESYVVLSSTNLALPLNAWNPSATNQLSASGEFVATLSDAVGYAPVLFIILQGR